MRRREFHTGFLLPGPVTSGFGLAKNDHHEFPATRETRHQPSLKLAAVSAFSDKALPAQIRAVVFRIPPQRLAKRLFRILVPLHARIQLARLFVIVGKVRLISDVHQLRDQPAAALDGLETGRRLQRLRMRLLGERNRHRKLNQEEYANAFPNELKNQRVGLPGLACHGFCPIVCGVALSRFCAFIPLYISSSRSASAMREALRYADSMPHDALQSFRYARDAVMPFPSVSVSVRPATTLINLSTCPLGHWISTASARACWPRPKVRTSSLADR